MTKPFIMGRSDKMAETNSIFLDLPDFYNKKINSEPKSEMNIAIDTKKTLTNEVIAAEEDKSLNIGDINSFSQQSLLQVLHIFHFVIFLNLLDYLN